MAARKDGDDTLVALKVLKPRYASDEGFVSRFLREAETAGELRHANIIRILDVGRDGEHVYFAMPRLVRSLHEALPEGAVMDEVDVVRTARDIAKALAFAHETGVIHRDIKPQNILFAEDGRAVLSDFGIARLMQNYTGSTGKRMVIGTPHYVSPEQARGEPLDGRTDIYALGVTMYRAVTGKLPFHSGDWYELARLHVEEPPEPPRQIRDGISKPFERIVLRCLAKNRDDRYPTAADLAAELDVLVSEPAPRTTAEFAIRAVKKMFGK